MKVLHLVMYDNLYPPMNGGMLRCWNLTMQLSLYFNVDLLCLQPGIEKIIKEDYPEISTSVRFIAPGENFNSDSSNGFEKLKTAIKYRFSYKTLSSTNSILVAIIPLLRKIKHNSYDLILFEHLESLTLVKKFRKHFPQAKFILDAHNVDHILLKNKLSKKKITDKKLQESILYKSCDAVLACSDKDAKVLKELNQNNIPVYTVPNGVDINKNAFQLPSFTSKRFSLIFCGSLDYQPNYTGLIWFLDSIWENVLIKVPFLQLIIVGRGNLPQKLAGSIAASRNIEFIGEVEDTTPYYRKAQLAIVPLLNGSGTRLKILEAMSLGVPVLSTAIGAEGINYTEGENILIAETGVEFTEQIYNYYIGNLDHKLISGNARKLVNDKYSWDKIGIQLYELFDKKLISN